MVFLKNTSNKIAYYVITFAFGIFLFGCNSAYAASLQYSPSAGDFTVGNILNVSILVNTGGKAINNADAVVNFPASLLEVISISKSGSIFTLWVEEPAFSNSAGTISFNGGLPTPGFNGTAGKLVGVVFRVRSPGVASLVFSSGAVRANDGYGTDILQTRAQAQFNLVSEEKRLDTPPIARDAPQAPKISSPTHPGPEKWYAKNTVTFTWPITTDITAARLSVGKIPTAQPAVLYAPPISKKTIENLEEGVGYFHAQLKNNSGWGGATHFRFQVDTKNPDRFDLTLAPRKDPTEPQVEIVFDAHDETSGVDHYEIQIDGKETIVWRDDGSKTFKTSALNVGTHQLVAKAIDRAGNYLTNLIEFAIEPLNVPIIVVYPKELESGEVLVVQGTTYPNAEVTVWLQKDGKTPNTFTVRSDGTGNFTFISEEGLSVDVYKLWAKVTNDKGANSNPSEKITFIVKQPTFLKIGAFAISLLSVLIPLIGLILLLVFMLWFGWHKFRNFKKRLRKEVGNVERDLHKAFDLLKEDIREQIKMLEKAKTKRQLTGEEEKVTQQLRKDLDDAEKFIRKEIENIEKEVE
ncbi:MAG TPA: hypothetical protein VJB70_04685 [Candidatus Paceibacterota bacterium]